MIRQTLLNKISIFRLFTAIFIVSSVLTLLLPAVSQAASLSTTSSLKDQVYSYTLYNSMIDCLSQDSQQSDNNGFGQIRTSESNLKSGTWWKTGGSLTSASTQGAESPASYLSDNVRGTSGGTLCNDIVKDSATLFGYSSIFKYACSFIQTRANNSSCETGTGDFDKFSPSLGSFKSTIQKKVWGNNTPSLTLDSGNKNAGLYLIYREAFLTGCSAKVSSDPGDDYAYKNIKIVTDDGGTTTKTYEGLKRDVNIKTYKPTDSTAETKSCADIASLVNQYANDFKAYLNAHPDDKGTVTVGGKNCSDSNYAAQHTDECGTASANSCVIDSIGWIVCPVVNFLSRLADGGFSFLSNNLLKTDTKLVSSSSDSPTYIAWTTMRTIANVVFVIVFLIIIFSQLTSVGITNYGVKKMLPRLVVAAILVNISFYICQIAVDLSNVLGFSLKDSLERVSETIKIGTGNTTDLETGLNSGEGFAGIAGGVLAFAAGGAAVYALLTTLIPVLLAAVVALVLILFLLIARQALIVMLVVLSPLAFVAYLLPNTEQLFTRWRKLFVSLLLLFPIVALVFGLSSLASGIIGSAFDSGNDANQFFAQIIAAGVLVLPLFVVPSMLKKSIDGIGTLSGKIQNIGAKVENNAGKAGSKQFEGSRLGQFQKYRQGEKALRRAQVQSGMYNGSNPLRKGLSNINKRINEGKISGKFGNRALATGAALADKEHAELVANADSRLDNTFIDGRSLSQQEMMNISLGKDVKDSTGKVILSASNVDTYTKQAAIKKAGKIATVPDMKELVDNSPSMTPSERKALTSVMPGSSALGKAPYYGGKTIGDVEAGTANTQKAILEAIKSGKVNSESIAGGDKNTASEYIKAVQSTPFGSQERQILKAAYSGIYAPGSRLGEKIVQGGEHDTTLQGIKSL